MKQFYVKPFNDHSNCKGHQNWMLDNTMETEEAREVMKLVLDHHIADYEKQIELESNLQK